MYIATDPAQEDALKQMRDVLQADFMSLRVVSYALREEFETGVASVTCSLTVNDGSACDFSGDGVGMIDALFNGFKARFAPENPSLESIRFSSFQVKGLIGVGARTPAGSDAKAEARVGVLNSYGNEFEFAAVSGSVSRSSVAAVTAAVEYFVNSERAYVTMYRAYQHYKAEGRVDLVSKYTARLSDMVRNTSYSAVIERLRAE